MCRLDYTTLRNADNGVGIFNALNFKIVDTKSVITGVYKIKVGVTRRIYQLIINIYGI